MKDNEIVNGYLPKRFENQSITPVDYYFWSNDGDFIREADPDEVLNRELPDPDWHVRTDGALIIYHGNEGEFTLSVFNVADGELDITVVGAYKSRAEANKLITALNKAKERAFSYAV